MYISTFRLSSIPSNSFVIFFIHAVFCSVLLVTIILSKLVWFLLHPVVGMLSCHHAPFVGRISFRLNVLLWRLCFTHSEYLFNLNLFASTFPQIVLLIFLMLSFSLFFTPCFLCFIILASFRRFFLSPFPIEFPSQVLIFFRTFWGEHIFSQTDFVPAYLIPLYYSLTYCSTRFIWPFPFWIFSILCFLLIVRYLFFPFIILIKFSKKKTFLFLGYHFICFIWVYIVRLCGVSIFRSWQFILLRLFLLVNTWCVWYSVTILLIISFLVYF